MDETEIEVPQIGQAGDVPKLGPGDLAEITLLIFMGIFACVAVSALFAFLRDRARLKLAARLLDRGQPVPAGLFDRRASTELLRGVVMLAAAVGVALFFLSGDNPELARAGLVPGAIGAGYLVGYWLERKRGHDGNAEPS
jgi:hypothetical protein